MGGGGVVSKCFSKISSAMVIFNAFLCSVLRHVSIKVSELCTYVSIVTTCVCNYLRITFCILSPPALQNALQTWPHLVRSLFVAAGVFTNTSAYKNTHKSL